MFEGYGKNSFIQLSKSPIINQFLFGREINTYFNTTIGGMALYFYIEP